MRRPLDIRIGRLVLPKDRAGREARMAEALKAALARKLTGASGDGGRAADTTAERAAEAVAAKVRSHRP